MLFERPPCDLTALLKDNGLFRQSQKGRVIKRKKIKAYKITCPRRYP
jgi:hypothetical protein